MNGFLDWVLGIGLVQTQIKKFITNIAAKAGVALAAWITALLVKHGYSIDQALSQHIALVGTAAGGLIIAAFQVFYDVITDPKRVSVALQASAQSGVVVPPPSVAGLKAGDQITVKGQTITLGKPSPAGVTADDLNRAELNQPKP